VRRRPGGLLVGQVSDRADGHTLGGATVRSATLVDETMTTRPTSDDPGIGDGIYILWAAGTGSQRFTASAYGYSAKTERTTIAPDNVTRLDFALRKK
jgi:hypothetical protein